MTLDRHDPKRNDALGLVRRQLAAGTFTNDDVARWKEELGDDVVDGLLEELAPPKKKTKKTAGAAPDKE